MFSTASQKLVILTEGSTEPIGAKTAASVIRYRAHDVVALLDTTQVGRTSGELLGTGGDIPVVGSFDDAPGADTLLMGIAPPGGKIPAAWRAIILEAIRRGMNVVSGLHDFLSDDLEFADAAKQANVRIDDIRKNNERDVSLGEPLGNRNLRIQTVGNDCCVGKMVVAIEVAKALEERGHRAKFLATGQTGIMIAGDGCPVDCVVSDFVNGAAERLVLSDQQSEFLLVEGQGSLGHPRYSAVTLGLLHGCQPQGLILCYEVGRTCFSGIVGRKLPTLTDLRVAYESVGRLLHPTRVIGVAMNGRRISAADAESEKDRVRHELDLPVCDVFRDGADELALAVERLRGDV